MVFWLSLEYQKLSFLLSAIGSPNIKFRFEAPRVKPYLRALNSVKSLLNDKGVVVLLSWKELILLNTEARPLSYLNTFVLTYTYIMFLKFRIMYLIQVIRKQESFILLLSQKLIENLNLFISKLDLSNWNIAGLTWYK